MRHYFGRFTAMEKTGAALRGWIKRSANDMNSFQLIPSDRDLRALVQLHPKQSSIPDTASRAVKIGRIIIIFKLLQQRKMCKIIPLDQAACCSCRIERV